MRIFALPRAPESRRALVGTMALLIALVAGLAAHPARAEVRIGKIAVSATVLSSCRLDVESTALQAARLLSGQDIAHRSQCNGTTAPAHSAVLESTTDNGSPQYAVAGVTRGTVAIPASGAQAVRIRYEINY